MYLRTCLLLFILFTGACANDDWRTASRESAGIAPEPSLNKEAVVLVLGARAWSWRGWFAIHTWIATKPMNAQQYTIYEVLGWRVRHGLPALSIRTDIPDRYWYGQKPELLWHKQGEDADRIINKINDAVERYPWKNTYRVFPGPNSNTFPAWLAKEIPEFDLDLPFRAIGSGWAGRD